MAWRIQSGDTGRYVYFDAFFDTGLSPGYDRASGYATKFTVYRSRDGGAAVAYTTPTINETDSTNMPAVYELQVDEDTTVDAPNLSEPMKLFINDTGGHVRPITVDINLDGGVDVQQIFGDTGSAAHLADGFLSSEGGAAFDRYWNAALRGEIDTGSATSITDSSLANDTGAYIGSSLLFNNGPNHKRSRIIKTHDGNNGIVTFDALPVKPTAGNQYVVIPAMAADISRIYGDTGSPAHFRQMSDEYDTGRLNVDVLELIGDTGPAQVLAAFTDRLGSFSKMDTGTFDTSSEKGLLNRVADSVWDEPDTGHNVAGTMGRHQQQSDTGSADTIARQIFEKANVDGVKFIEAFRSVAAACAGRISGAGTGTETFLGLDDATTRLVASVDSAGNRTAITRTLDTN